jgi:hypothetical protein
LAAAVTDISSGSKNGFGVADLNNRLKPWVHTLGRWRLRTWVNPIGDRQRWRRSLNQVPMRVWPMNSAGLLGAAYDVAMVEERRIAVGDRDRLEERPITSEDVRRLQRLVALVPCADLDLAELLRQQYCPDVPDQILLDLVRIGTDATGRVLRWPKKELAELLAEAREDTTLEEDVRRFLLQVYEDSEPEKNTVAYLRWRLDCAMQRVYLHDPEEHEINRGLTELEELAAGPLWEEVAEALDRLGVPGKQIASEEKLTIAEPLDRQARRKVEQLLNSAERGTTIDQKHVKTSIPAPGFLEIVMGTVVSLFLLVGAWYFGRIETETFDHNYNAYALEWTVNSDHGSAQPSPQGHLTLNMVNDDGSAPTSATLYQNDQPFGGLLDLSRPVEKKLFENDRGHWYQLRATMENENIALSRPLWVTGPLLEEEVCKEEGKIQCGNSCVDLATNIFHFSGCYTIHPALRKRKKHTPAVVRTGRDPLPRAMIWWEQTQGRFEIEVERIQVIQGHERVGAIVTDILRSSGSGLHRISDTQVAAIVANHWEVRCASKPVGLDLFGSQEQRIRLATSEVQHKILDFLRELPVADRKRLSAMFAPIMGQAWDPTGIIKQDRPHISPRATSIHDYRFTVSGDERPQDGDAFAILNAKVQIHMRICSPLVL